MGSFSSLYWNIVTPINKHAKEVLNKIEAGMIKAVQNKFNGKFITCHEDLLAKIPSRRRTKHWIPRDARFLMGLSNVRNAYKKILLMEKYIIFLRNAFME